MSAGPWSLQERMKDASESGWIVVKGVLGAQWWACAPRGDVRADRRFRTHAEALTYANTQARATMPTAAQIDQAEAAQDAELDGYTADAAAWDEANVNDALRRRP